MQAIRSKTFEKHYAPLPPPPPPTSTTTLKQ